MFSVTYQHHIDIATTINQPLYIGLGFFFLVVVVIYIIDSLINFYLFIGAHNTYIYVAIQ